MKKRFGFTLAEVLITLGIIGVVAAMTIPTLIQNTNSVKFASQFKKSVSTLSQAALMAQAQYDIDYAGLTGDSVDSKCGTDSLAYPKTEDSNKAPLYTVCGLFNSTLAGQTYQGKYGEVKGANASGNYAIAVKALPVPTNWLIFALADGSMVGFNPSAKNCQVTPGTPLDADLLKQDSQNEAGEDVSGGGLKNCLGFIDVNGPTPPNREVQCASDTSSGNSTTKLDPSEPCELSNVGSTTGDVFPIVFHDGTVEPATNAAKAILARGK